MKCFENYMIACGQYFQKIPAEYCEWVIPENIHTIPMEEIGS
jgi:hypothetical protein